MMFGFLKRLFDPGEVTFKGSETVFRNSAPDPDTMPPDPAPDDMPIRGTGIWQPNLPQDFSQLAPPPPPPPAAMPAQEIHIYHHEVKS